MSDKPLPSSFDGNIDFYEENRWEKITRRLKEEPLIPIGCGLTCWALYNASKSVRSGDHHRTQRMFRARIYAQAFTVVAMVAGSMYWQTDRHKRKEFDKVIEERKAKEKNDAWIRELEARDDEAKEEAAIRRGFSGKRLQDEIAREKTEREKIKARSVADALEEEIKRKAEDAKARVESAAADMTPQNREKNIAHKIHEAMFGKNK